jgi:hypothetical protein
MAEASTTGGGTHPEHPEHPHGQAPGQAKKNGNGNDLGPQPIGFAQDASGKEIAITEEDKGPSQAELDQMALDHEKAMARTRGAPEDQMRDWESKLLWVHSNRQDDRTVIYEPDPLHPGGQAFVGGEGPDHVYRTAAIEQLLQSGELIEVPEPAKTWVDPETGEEVPNPFYPDQNYSQAGDVPPAMPGQPIQLGRKLNPALWDEGQMKEIVRRQQYMPSYRPVPPGVIVPPAGSGV